MDNKLCHYGILGMKWGVRRFQKKNGSLTTEGEKRYKYTSHATKRMNAKAEKLSRKNDESASQMKARAKASQEFDDLQLEYAKKASVGKTFVRNSLMGAGPSKTYSMARSIGMSKGKAFIMSRFDLRLFCSGGPSLNQHRMRNAYIKSKTSSVL